MSDSQDLKIGIIGLDTSHVEAFTKLLNDPNQPHHVPGGKVVAAFPGGSPDFELSRSRVEGFTNKLRDEYQVEILDSPEAVAERVDLVMIESVDGRVHLDQFKRTVSYGKPTYIDKPLATTVADAEAILELAEKHGVPIMSCSSLRYAETFTAALANQEDGEITGIDTSGPMAIQPTQPGYFWYGIHSVEMMVAALGAGCRRVRAHDLGNHDVLIAEWEDGRLGTFHGLREQHHKFSAVLHRQKKATLIDASGVETPYYATLLAALFKSLPNGKGDVPVDEMLEVIRIMEAGNQSRESDGKVVELPALASA